MIPAMPIYEFHCKKCGKDAEVLVPSTSWKGTKCPSCGSEQLMKKLSSFAMAGSNPADDCGFASSCGNVQRGGRCCGGGSCGLN